MCPTLFHIGPIPIHGFGLMLAIGFLVTMYLAQKEAKYFNIPEQKLVDLFPWIIVGGTMGARLFHVIVERPSYFLAHPIDIIKLWDGGLTIYGGLFGAVITVYIFAKRNKLSFLKVSDFLVTYVPLGQTFGRLGCFLAGCCYGKPTDLPWGIAIKNPDSVTRPLGIPLHPTQLYLVLVNFVIFLILYRTSWRKKFAGQSILLYCLLFPLGRSLIEIFRGDEIRGYVIDHIITTSQGISLFVFIPSLIIYIIKVRQAKKEN